MQNRQATRMQRLKAALTKPITVKGIIAKIIKPFKSKEKPEPIRNFTGRNPAARKIDSNLWEIPMQRTRKERLESISRLIAHARELHRKAEKIRNETKRTRPNHEEANMLDHQAVDTYIRIGWIDEATVIGHEFQSRGHFREAAEIFSRLKDEIAFFKLVDHLHKVDKHELAVNIVRWNAGLRGVVKYNEIYNTPHPKLIEDFGDEEILDYSREMRFQKKSHHIFQLAELCENAGRYGIAAELYNMIKLGGAAQRCMREERLEMAAELRKNGRFLEAGELLFDSGMNVEVHEIAMEAANYWRNDEAAILFGMIGADKRALENTHIFAVVILESVKRLIAEGDMFEAMRQVQNPVILRAALGLMADGKIRPAYEIAESLQKIANAVYSKEVAKKLRLGASMIYRGSSPEQADRLAA